MVYSIRGHMTKSGSERGRGGIFDLLSWAVNWTGDEESRLIMLSLDNIVIDNHQPRRHFEQESLQQLSRSIGANGVIEPVLVRKLPNGGFQLIAGERRLRAARLAGSKEIPAIVSSLERESDIKKFQLIENLMRRDLNPVEEVCAYLDLLAARLANSPQGKELLGNEMGAGLGAGLAERRFRLAELLRKLAKDSKKSGAPKSLPPAQSVLVNRISTVFEEIGHTSWQDFVEKRLSVLSLPSEVLAALGEGWLSYEQARMVASISARTFGVSTATQERQKLLAWIKRKQPSLFELRTRITERRAELATNKPQAEPAKTRLDDLARRLQLLKRNRGIQLPQKLQNRLEKAMTNIETLIAEIEEL